MSRRGLRMLTALVVAAMGGGAIAEAAVHRTPLFVAGSWHGRRPTGIDISGDGGNIITKLRWRAWTDAYAYGVGTSEILSCVPDCATGPATAVRTTVTLSHPTAGHWTKLVEIRRGQRLTAHYGRPFWPLGAQ